MKVRSGGDGGAALIEFALLLPLLLMVILGLVSSGVAYNHKISLVHAARETSRYGATLPVSNFLSDPDPMARWLDELAVRAISDATGSLDAGTPGLRICVAYVHPQGSSATDSTRSRVETASASATYLTSECFADGRPDTERRVQVEVGRDADLDALLFQTTIQVGTEAVSRYEAGPGF